MTSAGDLQVNACRLRGRPNSPSQRVIPSRSLPIEFKTKVDDTLVSTIESFVLITTIRQGRTEDLQWLAWG